MPAARRRWAALEARKSCGGMAEKDERHIEVAYAQGLEPHRGAAKLSAPKASANPARP